MPWPNLPYPSGYQPPGAGFFTIMVVVLLVWIAVVLIWVSASGSLQEEKEEERELSKPVPQDDQRVL
jgi:hypothetical protein